MNTPAPVPVALPLRLIVVGAVVAWAALLHGLAGPGNVPAVLATLLAEGWVAAVNLLGAGLLGTAILRRIVPDAHAATTFAAGTAVGLGVLSAVFLAAGLAGSLTPAVAWGTVLAALLAGAADAYLARDRWTAAARRAGDWPAATWLLVGATVAGVGAVAAAAAAVPPGLLWPDDPLGYDVLAYHLQLPREWAATGTIAPTLHNVFGFMPLATESLFAAQMLQLGGTYDALYAAHVLNAGIVAVVGVGVYGTCREADVTPPAAAAAACVTLCVPWAVMLGTVAYNEPLAMLASAGVLGLLTRAARGGGDFPLGPAVAAGLVAGAGVAGKYTAVPMLVLAGAAGLLACAAVRRRPRLAAAAAVFLVVTPTLAFPWLVRNLAWTGNPVFPLATGVFGQGHFDDGQADRWRTAHAAPADASRAGRLASDLLLDRRYGYAFWPLAVAGLGLTLVRPGALRCGCRTAAVLAATVAVVILGTWLGFTHLQSRFLVWLIAPAGLGVGLLLTTLPPPARFGVAAGAAATGFVVSAVVFVGATRPFGDAGVYGLTTLGLFGALEAHDPADPRPVLLAGDARALLYPVPDLTYRSVFDVPTTTGGGAIEAWLGDALQTAPASALIVVDFAELDRFHRTYGTPEVEPAARAAAAGRARVVWPASRVRSLVGQGR